MPDHADSAQADSGAAQPSACSAQPDDAWSGDRVARWLEQAPRLERQLAPVSGLLFAAAGIAAGEHVLDVGCGTGPTTREAAALAGPAGRVTGLDVSAAMLAAAAESTAATAHAGRSAPIDWVEGDAVSWSPPTAAYDVAMSRFGVMFFSDPSAAMTNVAASVRPGGRFAAAVWGERPESPLFEVPYRIARSVLAARGMAVDALPTDAGPFSWHEDSFVVDLLGAAGWRDATVEEHVLALPFGGGAPPEDAAVEARGFGPTRLVLAGVDEATLAAVHEALAAEFADHLDAAGHVVLDATVHIITAVR